MAGFRLGYFRRIPHSRHPDKLSSPSVLLDGIQVLYRTDDGGFHTLPNLASYRRFQDIWFSLSQGSFHYDLYVFSDSISLTEFQFSPDNGTGAPAGWNWILSLCVISFFWKRIALIERFASLFTAGTMTGFDASGHIAEETKNAR